MPEPKNLKQLFILSALLLIFVFALIQYSVEKEEEKKLEVLSSFDPVLKGQFQTMQVFDEPKILPEFVFKTILGNEMTLDDLNGQWTILNFWASWCPPCLHEMPSLQLLQDEYGEKGLRVVGINLDRDVNAKDLQKFMILKNFGAISAYYDPVGRIMRDVPMRGLPTTYIINPIGEAVAIYNGDADWMSDNAKLFITSLLIPAQP